MPHLLLRLALVFATLSVWGAGPPAKPKKPTDADEQIAQQAAILGRNRLAQDPKDGPGLKLIQLALLLTPEDEVALLTLGLMEKGQPLEPVATKASEDRLLDYILTRAQELQDKELPKNNQVAVLCQLYFRLLEVFRPRDEKVILGLMKLKAKGFDSTLADLLSRPLNLASLFVAAKDDNPAPAHGGTPQPPAGGEKAALDPRRTAELRGIGCDDTKLTAMYGKPTAKEFIAKSGEYRLTFRTGDTWLVAWMHSDKCRRLERQTHNPGAIKTWLKLDTPNTVWRQRTASRWETENGEYLAIYVPASYNLQIWDKEWYEKHGGH